MARRFAKVSEEEIEEAFFYPSDLVNTKTTIPLRVGEERWIYTSTLRVSVYIHHYSPPLRGIVVYYFHLFLNLLFVYYIFVGQKIRKVWSPARVLTRVLARVLAHYPSGLTCASIRYSCRV